VTAYALDENHDLYLRGGQIARVAGPDYVVQSIKTRLQTFLGESWVDVAFGVPWFQKLLGRPGSSREAEFEIRKVITETEGVVDLTTFDVAFDRRERRSTITFEALTEFGPSGVEVVTVG